MHSDVEQFLEHSQFYLNYIPIIKNEIDRLNQSDLYFKKLNEFDKILRNLREDIYRIEQSYSDLDENNRLKMDEQIQLLRNEIDREISELHRLREEDTIEENNSSINNELMNNVQEEDDDTSNVLRQRHITRNPLNDTYDLLERDLAYLRDRIDEVQALVTEQEQKLSKLEYYKTIARNRVSSVSSFLQNTLQNRYVTTASGAVIGAGIGGPVGFMMGTKIGALVALTGSALGALSMNIMRQSVTETDESQNNTIAYSQAML